MGTKFVIVFGICFILICLAILIIIELVYDSKIKKAYDNMIYNWNSNPIKSIELIEENKNENYELTKIKTNKDKYSFYSWRNKYFKVEKLTDYDYNNIYINENGKLCGKDSFGNNLYFPENIDCPINSILFSYINISINNPNIKKLNIDNDYYLYYTNTSTNGKIVVDIKAGSPNGLQLNFEKDNDICSTFLSLNKNIFTNNKEKCSSFTNFTKYISLSPYKKLDTWQYKNFINKKELEENDDVVLYSINYLGVNSTLIDKRESLKDYKKNIEKYKKLFIYKCIMYFISLLFFITPRYYAYNNTELYHLMIALIFLIIIIIHFIIIVINFTINRKYIQNILYKINKDFEDNKIKNTFNILNLIITCLLLILNILSIIFYYRIKNGSYLYKIFENKNNTTNNKIKKNNNNDNTKEEKRTDTESDRTDINNNQGAINNSKINQEKHKPIGKNTIKEIKFDKDCVFCHSNPSKYILFPCKHCLCKDCYEYLKDSIKNCLKCKIEIESITQKTM